MSQKQRILKHLRATGDITPYFALRNYGCFRLAARINELRMEGHEIVTRMVRKKDGGKFAAYHYMRGPKQAV